ncbi:MAG TPA: hypothetical protein VGO91_07485 [Pyrinomonadaceae bacterium]|jgi:hypothetical protein|nr:hypothetical protein [Pyrinomonadaceae bacterium]
MKYLRQLLLPIIALLVLAGLWLYWWRPQKVDMTAYVPADSIVYLEADSLPLIANGIVKTDAWKTLAPLAGITESAGEVGWLSSFAARTGIGPADVVVLSRAQVAVAVLGLETGDAGEALKIRPRIALVAETQTGEGRTRAAVEKLVGDFARRAYGNPSVKNEEKDGLKFITWTAPEGVRSIVAVVESSVAVIGNDEDAVRACLAVRHNQRPSLSGSQQLAEMRGRVSSGDAVAFGYVSPAGASYLLEFAAKAYAGQLSSNTQAQSMAATILPSLANKILGGVGWSTRFVGGAVEDRYFLALQNGIDASLRGPLSSSANATVKESELLPADTYSFSRYNYRDPAAAWRGLNATLSSQVGALEAVFINGVLNQALKPYGIEEPQTFLRAIGPEIVTARLDDSGSSTVTIVEVRDEKALRDFVAQRLGANAKTERIGETLMQVSRDEERGAASFIEGHLLMGSATNVQRCLAARAQNQTLANADDFQRAARMTTATDDPASVVTYTGDETPARAFVNVIASQRNMRGRSNNNPAINQALGQLTYAVSETRLVQGGFEKRTRSSFGQVGTLATQFAPER